RVGETLALAASARDASGDAVPESEIVWRSLTPTVASVDASGIVRALAAGHGAITASVDGVSESVAIDVRP
ncbi:MAG TPA: Ig-like domain-containing protein, partial [Gemmatimonadaceae bacterium]|nr:Ig-like domain-containing protein [Gemmatimonadaceae bacterium]